MSNATVMASFWSQTMDGFCQNRQTTPFNGAYGTDAYNLSVGSSIIQYDSTSHRFNVQVPWWDNSHTVTSWSDPCDQVFSWDDYLELRSLKDWWYCPIYDPLRKDASNYGAWLDNLIDWIWWARKEILTLIDIVPTSGVDMSTHFGPDSLPPLATVQRFLDLRLTIVENGIQYAAQDPATDTWFFDYTQVEKYIEIVGCWSFLMATNPVGPFYPSTMWNWHPAYFADQPNEWYFLTQGSASTGPTVTALSTLAQVLAAQSNVSIFAKEHQGAVLAMLKGWPVTLPASDGTIDTELKRLAVAVTGLGRRQLLIRTKRGTILLPGGGIFK